jgi:hypothetical protein
MLEGESVSWLWIVPFTLCVGQARVRMDGIGGVGTKEQHRNRGYSRRVLEAAVERMRQGDAALSMLYGIQDFYPKFGYATAGPDQYFVLKEPGAGGLPPGWQARFFEEDDGPALQRLYEEQAGRGVGAALREPGAWRRLIPPNGEPTDCRVLLDPAGAARGYAWKCAQHWYVSSIRSWPLAVDALVVAEVMADGPATADALLGLCRAWAVEESVGREKPLERVLISMPPEGSVAAAAMRQDAEGICRYSRCGASMARVLDTGRLLAALEPELAARAGAARMREGERLRIETEVGSATIGITADGVAVSNATGSEPETLCLPQPELARLALGAFPPGDLLDRLGVPEAHAARRVVPALFPQRRPHMWVPDRF